LIWDPHDLVEPMSSQCTYRLALDLLGQIVNTVGFITNWIKIQSNTILSYLISRYFYNLKNQINLYHIVHTIVLFRKNKYIVLFNITLFIIHCIIDKFKLDMRHNFQR